MPFSHQGEEKQKNSRETSLSSSSSSSVVIPTLIVVAFVLPHSARERLTKEPFVPRGKIFGAEGVNNIFVLYSAYGN